MINYKTLKSSHIIFPQDAYYVQRNKVVLWWRNRTDVTFTEWLELLCWSLTTFPVMEQMDIKRLLMWCTQKVTTSLSGIFTKTSKSKFKYEERAEKMYWLSVHCQVHLGTSMWSALLQLGLHSVHKEIHLKAFKKKTCSMTVMPQED